MPKTIWSFSIAFDNENSLQTNADGIYAASAEDVDYFGEVSGLHVDSSLSPRFGMMKTLKVSEEESSEALAQLLGAIKERYGYEPSQSFIWPLSKREQWFGVQRDRTYSEEEIQEAELLYFYYATQEIAEQRDPSPQQLVSEIYVGKGPKGGPRRPFGTLTPSHALAVDTGLKQRLEEEELEGLLLDEPVVGAKDTWRLFSSIILPRCRLPLIDGITGEEVVPYDVWPEKWGDRWYDDCGYRPPELVYEREALQALEFDIAMTAERTGVNKERAFRWCVVSQKFRSAMIKLKVPGVRYVPVRLV